MIKLILNILSIGVWLVTAAGIPLLMGFARTVHYQRPVSQIEVRPLNKHQADFVTAEEIITEIRRHGSADMTLHTLNNRHIEHSILLNPYVSHAKAYTTLDRRLVVNLTERVPMMRVVDVLGQWHYIDSAGAIFPVHPERLFRLLPAIGNIEAPVKLPEHAMAMATDTLHNKTYSKIHQLGKLILRDEFMRLLVDYIYVDDQQNFELIPMIGQAEVFLGQADHLPEKVANVGAFYKNISTTASFGLFSHINASFENQIVCTIKRDSI